MLKNSVKQFDDLKRTLGLLSHHDSVTSTSSDVTIESYYKALWRSTLDFTKIIKSLLNLKYDVETKYQIPWLDLDYFNVFTYKSSLLNLTFPLVPRLLMLSAPTHPLQNSFKISYTVPSLDFTKQLSFTGYSELSRSLICDDIIAGCRLLVGLSEI